MSLNLRIHDDLSSLEGCEAWLFIGRHQRLLADDVRALLPAGVSPTVWTAVVGPTALPHDGRATTTFLDGPVNRLIAGVLPDYVSRHNTPTRSWCLPTLMSSIPAVARTAVVVAADDPAHLPALAAGIARAVPTYHANPSATERSIEVVFLGCADATALRIVADAVRRAANLVDLPPAELGPTAFVDACLAVAQRTGAHVTTIIGPRLHEQGLGGLWGVGRAATQPPALVVLDHVPTDPEGHDAWVGKGITYDTGGLSIKAKTSMPGMKTDMAGAAAVLCAFEAAVRLGSRRRITAVLCVAENAVGPDATRPDDILRLYSGRSCEVNNTDAEGRLVLADGLAWVRKHRSPGRIIDLATLTGAAAMATGVRIAALVSNDADLEAHLVDVGRRTGDLTFPLPFVPEFFRREFQSKVADFKNSVKDRNNAQSSCAAEFLHLNLPDDTVPWAHVDMAAPAHASDRGTGYGVALLLGAAGLI
jgi:probable aminopeptidase NPEPL1